MDGPRLEAAADHLRGTDRIGSYEILRVGRMQSDRPQPGKARTMGAP